MALPSITSRPSKTIGSFTSKWNAVHNPIVYKITNDKWPTNSVDSADNITDHTDYAGNVEFTIAGHSYSALQWVTIASSDISSYNGVWQITAITTNTIILDLPYEAGTLGSPTALKYYQNYHLLIQVYAGIPGTHTLTADDPIEFIATQRAIPGLDNIALVDVSELVRDKIIMANSPANNDENLWTAFYIYYSESYDNVVSGEIVQAISAYTDDSANIFFATHAKMLFQNTYGGNVGEWVITSNHQGKLLTKFSQSALWPGLYFDICFALNTNSTGVSYTEYDKAGSSLNTGTVSFTYQDEGIYRIRLDTISFLDNTDYIIIHVMAGTNSEDLRIDIIRECSNQNVYLTWLNNLGGFDYWNFTARSEYGSEFGDTETFKKNIFQDWDENFVNGETVESFNKIEAWNNITVRSQLLTREQIDGIANIKYSPLVQQIRDDGSKITVLIDKEDFKIREDHQRLFSIEFKLRYTNKIPVQYA